VQIEQTTATYTIGSTDSISGSPDWEASWRWAKRWEGVWASQTTADFIASQALRYALQARDWHGVQQLMSALSHNGVPSASNAAFAVSALVSRQRLERLAVAIAKSRSRLGRWKLESRALGRR
jgi:hypothetical protein